MAEKLCTLRTQGGGGGAKYTETSLWTNNAPTSVYAGGTVSLSDDINNYDVIKVRYKYTQNTSVEFTVECPVSDFKTYTGSGTGRLTLGVMASSGIGARALTYASDTSVLFSGAGYVNGSAWTVNNGLCLPTYIIGCKFR